MSQERLETGRKGEGDAEKYLKYQGYRVIERNFRCRIGEIDIIAEKKGRIFFLEVKTRNSRQFGEALESVTPTKQAKIMRVAEYYLMKKKWEGRDIGFAVIAINLGDAQSNCELIEFTGY
jgi:putative endonuclease